MKEFEAKHVSSAKADPPTNKRAKVTKTKVTNKDDPDENVEGRFASHHRPVLQLFSQFFPSQG